VTSMSYMLTTPGAHGQAGGQGQRREHGVVKSRV
jgi:hypothetical protein